MKNKETYYRIKYVLYSKILSMLHNYSMVPSNSILDNEVQSFLEFVPLFHWPILIGNVCVTLLLHILM